MRTHERTSWSVLFIAGQSENAALARRITRTRHTCRGQSAIGLNRRRRRTTAISADQTQKVASTVANVRDKRTNALLYLATAFSDAQRGTSERQYCARHVLRNAGGGQPIPKVFDVILPSRQGVADFIDRVRAAVGLHESEARNDPARENVSGTFPYLTCFRTGGRR
jgi:hypothetical protein